MVTVLLSLVVFVAPAALIALQLTDARRSSATAPDRGFEDGDGHRSGSR